MYATYMVSVLRLKELCYQRGVEMHLMTLMQESLVTRARNTLARIFLESHLSHMIFIDADIEFEPEDILRMYESDLPVLGGIYPKKRLHLERLKDTNELSKLLDYVVVAEKADQHTQLFDTAVPLKVRYVGTGLMMIRRSVFLKMIEHGCPKYATKEDGDFHCFFDTRLHDDGTYLSEDYDFCQRWRDIGGEVFAAPWTHTTHWGSHGYSAKPSAKYTIASPSGP